MTAIELIRYRGGAVAASDWITPDFKKLPIPAGAIEIGAREISRLHGIARTAVEKLLTRRPKVRRVIVVVNDQGQPRQQMKRK